MKICSSRTQGAVAIPGGVFDVPIASDGSQPWIADVLRGATTPGSTTAPRDAKPVSARTLKKIASVVSCFEALQHVVFGISTSHHVVQHVSIRAFLKRAKVAGPEGLLYLPT